MNLHYKKTLADVITNGKKNTYNQTSFRSSWDYFKAYSLPLSAR